MKQITILSKIDNDTISTVMATLAHAGIDIHSITADHYGHQTVIHVITDDEALAIRILQKNPNWQVMREDALLLEIVDKTGVLAEIARHFDNAGTPLRSIRFVERYDGHALVAITTEGSTTVSDLIKEIENEQNLIRT